MAKKARQAKRPRNPLVRASLTVAIIGRRKRIQCVHSPPNETVRDFVAGLTSKKEQISLTSFRSELMSIQPDLSPSMMAFYWKYYCKKTQKK